MMTNLMTTTTRVVAVTARRVEMTTLSETACNRVRLECPPRRENTLGGGGGGGGLEDRRNEQRSAVALKNRLPRTSPCVVAHGGAFKKKKNG